MTKAVTCAALKGKLQKEQSKEKETLLEALNLPQFDHLKYTASDK